MMSSLMQLFLSSTKITKKKIFLFLSFSCATKKKGFRRLIDTSSGRKMKSDERDLEGKYPRGKLAWDAAQLGVAAFCRTEVGRTFSLDFVNNKRFQLRMARDIYIYELSSWREDSFSPRRFVERTVYAALPKLWRACPRKKRVRMFSWLLFVIFRHQVTLIEKKNREISSECLLSAKVR